jgi:hypothetical protein
MIDARKFIQRLIRELPKTVDKALDEIGDVAYHSVINTTRFKNYGNSGLRGATKIIPNGEYSREILSDKPYAFWVEEGNNQKGPYIYPVRAQALHFFIDGEEIFAKKVRSHGPLPYFTDAHNDVETHAHHIIENEINNLISGIV